MHIEVIHIDIVDCPYKYGNFGKYSIELENSQSYALVH